MTASEIREENHKRNAQLAKENKYYNPYTGYGSFSIERTFIKIDELAIPEFYAPNEMLSHEIVKFLIQGNSIRDYLISIDQVPSTEAIKAIIRELEAIRVITDFEYTAAAYFKIKPKASKDPVTGKDIVQVGDIPFILNRGQRKLLKKLEEMRLAGVPIRIILLKARQWGGSTLIQLYMAWIQLFRHVQWNSVICAQVDNTARIIKGMYTKLLKNIPPELIDASAKVIQMTPYEKSSKTSIIKERDCRITIGSAQSPDGVRGEDVVMAHCSEIGIWKKTEGKTPEDILNSVTSGIPMVSDTMIAYESTAKGVGNLFHREWKRAEGGQSNFEPVFIAWFDIDNNAQRIPKEELMDFIRSLTDYEKTLWSKGVTLEQINWYRQKSKDYPTDWGMKQEYPSDSIEAFQSTGQRVFDIYRVEAMRKFCRKPICYGEVVSSLKLEDCITQEQQKAFISNLSFDKYQGTPEKDTNILNVWALPTDEYIRRRYVVAVDIGGRSDKSDWSVITVFDRKYMMEAGGVPEKVAQWRGHIDHDLLAWKAVMIAKFYNDALLVFESNTYETAATEGDHYESILKEVGNVYTNMYARNSEQRIKEGLPPKWGFHMNVSTKGLVINNMIKMLREEGYYERCFETCNEMDEYEVKENGSLGAIEGCHDDTLMSTAIGIYVCYDFKYLPLPEEYTPPTTTRTTKKMQQRTEATF